MFWAQLWDTIISTLKHFTLHFTTPEGTPVPQHWITYACSASDFFKAALFISDFIIIIIIIV